MIYGRLGNPVPGGFGVNVGPKNAKIEYPPLVKI